MPMLIVGIVTGAGRKATKRSFLLWNRRLSRERRELIGVTVDVRKHPHTAQRVQQTAGMTLPADFLKGLLTCTQKARLREKKIKP